MCMQDVAMMKHTKSYQQSSLILAASQSVLLTADPNRWSVTIPPPDTGDLLLSIVADGSTTIGIRLFNGSNPLVLDRSTHGELVGKEILAVCPGGNETVTIWVTTLTIPIDKLVGLWKEMLGDKHG